MYYNYFILLKISLVIFVYYILTDCKKALSRHGIFLKTEEYDLRMLKKKAVKKHPKPTGEDNALIFHNITQKKKIFYRTKKENLYA